MLDASAENESQCRQAYALGPGHEAVLPEGGVTYFSICMLSVALNVVQHQYALSPCTRATVSKQMSVCDLHVQSATAK